MNQDLEIVYSEIDCENSRHKMELQKLEYLKLKEEVEYRKNINELIGKKYALINEITKCNRSYLYKSEKYKPEKISL